MSEHQITYEGSAPFLSLFVQCLRDEGVEVDAPSGRATETRGAGAELHVLVASLVASGAYDVIKLVISRFLRRHPRARVTIDGRPIDAATDTERGHE